MTCPRCTDFNIAGWEVIYLPHTPLDRLIVQSSLESYNWVNTLWIEGIWELLVLGVSSLLVSPFASCFFLRVELLFPWGPQLNHLLREMRTGYNSCYCGFAETLKYLTGLCKLFEVRG